MASVTFPIQLSWGDMDIFGHINNVAYLRYMETGRALLIEKMGVEILTAELGQIVVRNEVNYRKQLEFREEHLQLEIWISHLGNSSYDISYELKDDAHIYMDAKTRLVCLNMQTGLPTRIPENLREIFAQATRY
jgi:acyl-CoA thioester hydrolase